MAELAAGRKTSHWMWFVFPQARSLGRSSTAAFYGIGSLAEAHAYLLHPVLGARLIRAAQTASTAPVASVLQLFGSPDDLKFRIRGASHPRSPNREHGAGGVGASAVRIAR
nr:DUF1810 family protein [Brevundimonas sp. Leaf168]